MKYLVFLIVILLTPTAYAAEPTSVGALEFADGNTLFVADPDAGQIIAYTLPKVTTAKKSIGYNQLGFAHAVAKILGVSDRDLTFNDLAARPINGEVWVSATVNAGNKKRPVMLRANQAGDIKIVDLSKFEQTSKQLGKTASDGVKF